MCIPYKSLEADIDGEETLIPIIIISDSPEPYLNILSKEHVIHLPTDLDLKTFMFTIESLIQGYNISLSQ